MPVILCSYHDLWYLVLHISSLQNSVLVQKQCISTAYNFAHMIKIGVTSPLFIQERYSLFLALKHLLSLLSNPHVAVILNVAEATRVCPKTK